MSGSLAAQLEAALARQGTKARAGDQKAYLKSALVHLGVTVPKLRATVAMLDRAQPPMTHDDLVATARALWSRGIYELRAAAVELLLRRSSLLGPRDVPLIERLIRDAHTWALVDVLAPAIIGPLVVAHPALGRTLDRWANDPEFWVRRAALLALLGPLRGGGGDFDRFGRYADAMLEDKEFFIRKAIGWVLRDTSKKRPAMIAEWLAPRMHRASGVTLREALKYLDVAPAAKAVPARAGTARTLQAPRSGRRLAR